MATKPRYLKTPVQLWVADNRKRLGLTPADLARETGVTTDTARGWESRGAPSQDALNVLTRIFGEKPPTVAGPERGDTASGLADLVAAISSLVAAIEQDRQERTATRKLVEENRQKIDQQDQSIGQLTERLRLVEAQLEATNSGAPLATAG